MKNWAALVVIVSFISGSRVNAGDWVVYEGKAGAGKGKHIVFLSGDEEYRSEEGLPMLAKILARRHGFKCTVVFAVNPPGWSSREIKEFTKANQGAPEPKPGDPDPNDGNIDPNEPTNLPGLDQLDSADLVIMLWRFRRPTDEAMQHFVKYFDAGKPFVALRTSTHAFAGLQGEFAKFNQFGKTVLGEEWVS